MKLIGCPHDPLAQHIGRDCGCVKFYSNQIDYYQDPHRPGVKSDQGKTLMALVLGDFARALWAIGEVGTFGAKKYTESGWIHVDNGERRYRDAMMRHLMTHLRGEELDSESGLPHLAHAAWCCLAVLDLRIRKQEENGTQRTDNPTA